MRKKKEKFRYGTDSLGEARMVKERFKKEGDKEITIRKTKTNPNFKYIVSSRVKRSGGRASKRKVR